MKKTNRSNSKIVRKKISEHIFEHYEDIELLKEDVKALKYGNRSTYQAARELVKGGGFLIFTYSIKKFIENLELNNNSKIETFELYTHLLAREITKMIEKAGK